MSNAFESPRHAALRRIWIEHWRQFDAYRCRAELLRETERKCIEQIRADRRPEYFELLGELDRLLNALRWPEYPDELRDYTCGAKTRAGTPCKQRHLYVNGRCKFHGGASTGPVTEAGKERARENGKLGGRPRKKPKPI